MQMTMSPCLFAGRGLKRHANLQWRACARDARRSIPRKTRSKACRLFKVLGTENPADLLTKPLPRAEIDSHLRRLGLSRATGRAETAPRADASVDTTLADRVAK